VKKQFRLVTAITALSRVLAQNAETPWISMVRIAAVDAYVLYLLSTVVFPSWTSPVRIRSPAPLFSIDCGELTRYCDYCVKP
jgi:hypothetical protein